MVINLTESLHGQHALTLKPGDHRYLYKDSDVNFGDAFLTSEAELQSYIAIGSAKPHDPMDPKIVTEIINRAKEPHPAFTRYLIKFLR